MNRIKDWWADRWEPVAWWLYKKTQHHFEGQINDAMMHDLLNKMGAPTHPDNNPKRCRYGHYGRLRAYCVERNIVDPSEVI